MKLEGEYAVDKGERVHRVLSLAVYVGWVVLAFYASGIGYAVRTAIYYMMPMICIWFPEAMASYTGYMMGLWRNVQYRSHPTFLRWGAWFLLLVVPLILFALAVGSKAT